MMKRAVVALVAVLMLVAWPAFMWLFADSAWNKLRADTSADAVVAGDSDCVTQASFVGPNGARRTVDLTTRAECNARHDVGDTITVYYDADAPAHVVSSRWLFGDFIALGVGVLALPLMVSAYTSMRVLVDQLGRQLATWTLERGMRAARAKVAGLPPDFRYHDLRHHSRAC